MGKGDGFKRDIRCPKCGTYSPGWRPNCMDASCGFYFERRPDNFPVPSHEQLADAYSKEYD